MSEIRLAGNLVPTTTLGISGQGWGHFQIVFVDDAGNQTELEVQAPTTIFGFPVFSGSWIFVGPENHTLSTNYNIEGSYAFTTLNLGSRDALQTWQTLLSTHTQFANGDSFPGYYPEYNSNSYASALMSVIGFSISDFIANTSPSEVARFPGSQVNPLDIEEDAPDLQLHGNIQDDIIHTGLGTDTLAGGQGGDFQLR